MPNPKNEHRCDQGEQAGLFLPEEQISPTIRVDGEESLTETNVAFKLFTCFSITL